MNRILRNTLALIISSLAFSVSAQFTPNIVMEEATGEWCGWCPRGIVGIEQMLEIYTDGSFIPIAVHDYRDEFSMQSYIDQMHTTNFPQADFQRILLGESLNFNIMNNNYKSLRANTVSARIAVMPELQNNMIDVRTVSEFAANSQAPYYVAIVLTENKVIGKYQSNYYAGGANGVMGGFENLPSTIYDFEFNHVARLIYPSYDGEKIANSVKAGDFVEKTFTISLPKNISDPENVNVIALLLQNGQIINAQSVPLCNFNKAIPFCDSMTVSPTLRYAKEGVKISSVLDNTTNTDLSCFVRYNIENEDVAVYSPRESITIGKGAELVYEKVVKSSKLKSGKYKVSLEASLGNDEWVVLSEKENVEIEDAANGYSVSLKSFSINGGKIGNVPCNHMRVRAEIKCDSGVFDRPLTFMCHPQDYNWSTKYVYENFENLLFDDVQVLDFTIDMSMNGMIGEAYFAYLYYTDENGNTVYLKDGSTFCLGEATTLPVVNLSGQTISWDQEFPNIESLQTLDLTASASSGLPVKYVITENREKAIIENGVLTALHPGDITIVALQPGNESFAPALPVEMKLSITGEEPADVSVAAITSDSDPEYFNLQGIRVTNPSKGEIYIVKQSGKISKQIIR